MIKIYSGHGAEIHDLSTTSFRSASAIPSTTNDAPRARKQSKENPCNCV